MKGLIMRILLFAHLKNAVGRTELDFPWDDLDADSLWRKLTEVYPELARFRPAVRLARNSEYAKPGTRFYRSDEVALIPPVSGG